MKKTNIYPWHTAEYTATQTKRTPIAQHTAIQTAWKRTPIQRAEILNVCVRREACPGIANEPHSTTLNKAQQQNRINQADGAASL